ncbi:hypothetical protein [Lamprobacter modestohalophilus]|nr:hypothetical protein [Lamprobacter modestohalophilus]
MSTRAWYDYYLIDPGSGTMTLAMRFYKWGDGTPENALAEYRLFRERLQQLGGQLPVAWLDRLLRDQLGDLHVTLPPQFATAAFLFLLQRASDEEQCQFWHRYKPPEEWPDFHLRFALDEALTDEPFDIPPQTDPLLERVRRFLATAQYLRPWRDYALRLDLLHWLQYITQPTRSADMGAIAGDWQPVSDIAYRFRFFFWIDSQRPLRIGQMAIELCRYDGTDLLSVTDATADAWECKQRDALREIIHASDINITSLAPLQHDYATTPDSFWQFREQPNPEETTRRARLEPLRPIRNILVRQIEKRFGPTVADETRSILEQVDDFDLLLELTGPVIDALDSAAWLRALRQVCGP